MQSGAAIWRPQKGNGMDRTCKPNWVLPLALVLLGSSYPSHASNINGINGGMPNRISMNVTVPKQTQGATFGEKVNAGLHAAGSALAQGASSIIIECGQDACAIAFPDGRGIRADTTRMTLQPLSNSQAAALRKGGTVAQGASLLGGALPGGSVISAVVSSVGSLGGGAGGATAASYAATGRVSHVPSLADGRQLLQEVDVHDALMDGDYLVTVVVTKAPDGLKDTLKTQVRAAVTQQVRIDVGFSVEAGVLKTKHDTAKNSVGNIR